MKKSTANPTFISPRRFSIPLTVLAVFVASSQFLGGEQSPTAGSNTQSAVSYLNPPDMVRSPRYSQAGVVNGGRLAFISGQTALDANGQLIGAGDFRKQAAQVFANLGKALTAAGTNVDGIVNINASLVNVTDLAAYREARQAFFSGRTNPPPTSTTVQVAGLVTEGALLEVSAIAVVSEQRSIR